MAHEFHSGFFARQKAWHGLGTVVEGELTAADAIVTAGLDRKVEVVDTFTEDGAKAIGRAVRYTDDGSIVGNVGQGYVPVQNKHAFDFLDDAIKSGAASFHTAGSLKGGRLVWINCRLPQNIGKDIDPVESYISFVNSHDGSKAVTFIIHGNRIVCNNTMEYALYDAKQSGRIIKARHSRNVLHKIDVDVRRLIAKAEGRIEEFDKAISHLVDTRISDDDFKKFMIAVQPPPKDAKSLADVPTRTQNIWADLNTLYRGGPGADLETAKGTAWGAYNAVTNYADHWRTTHVRGGERSGERAQDEAKAVSLMFGSAAEMKRKALDHLLQMVELAPTAPAVETSKDGGDTVNRIADLVDLG